MHSVLQLVEAAREHSSIQSDYRLAKILDVTSNTVANWRHGRSKPDDISAFKLAELAGLDPFYALACVQAERATKEDAKSLWISLANRLMASPALPAFAIFALAFIGIDTLQAVDFACFFPIAVSFFDSSKDIHCGNLLACVPVFCTMERVAPKIRSFCGFYLQMRVL